MIIYIHDMYASRLLQHGLGHSGQNTCNLTFRHCACTTLCTIGLNYFDSGWCWWEGGEITLKSMVFSLKIRKWCQRWDEQWANVVYGLGGLHFLQIGHISFSRHRTIWQAWHVGRGGSGDRYEPLLNVSWWVLFTFFDSFTTPTWPPSWKQAAIKLVLSVIFLPHHKAGLWIGRHNK